MSPRVLLALGVISVGAAAPLIRLTQLSPLYAAHWRTLIGGIVLAAMAVVFRQHWPRAQQLRRAMLCGVVLGVHFALWFVSLHMTTVAASTVLVCMQPVFVAVLAHFILKEKTSRRGGLGIAISLVGAIAIAVDATAGTAPSPAPLLGAGLALAGAVVVALYPIFARGQSEEVGALAFSSVVALTAAVTLLPCAVLLESPPNVANVNWLALLLLALVPTVVGQTALNAALRRLPAAQVSGAILGEPVVAALVAALVLGERPGPLTLCGTAIVLMGLVLLLQPDAPV